MDLVNKEVIRGTLQYLQYSVTGNHSNRKLTFLLKEDPNSTIRIIYKRNALAGGSDASISSVYDGVHTTINVRIEPSDSEGLTLGYYSYSMMSASISDPSDIVNLVSGYVNLLPNVQLPNDITYSNTGAYSDLLYDRILMLRVAKTGVITVMQDIGFNVDLVCVKQSEGLYKISTSSPIFTSDLEIEALATQTGTVNTAFVYSNDLTFSLYELLISSRDIVSAMLLDSDFILSIKRPKRYTVDTGQAVPGTFTSNATLVGTVAIQLSVISVPCKRVIILNNTVGTTVYLGGSNVTPQNGSGILLYLDQTTVEVDDVNKIYAISSAPNTDVRWRAEG